MEQQDQIRFMRLINPSEDDRDFAATYEEIGNELGITKQAAEQLCHVALYKFRQNFIRECFGKYYDCEI